MTRVEIKTVAITPPQAPPEIARSDFNHFEVITQANLEKIIKDVLNGDREPLNHVCLPYNYWLNMATWMKAVENYILSSEQYFLQVVEVYDETMSK